MQAKKAFLSVVSRSVFTKRPSFYGPGGIQKKSVEWKFASVVTLYFFVYSPCGAHEIGPEKSSVLQCAYITLPKRHLGLKTCGIELLASENFHGFQPEKTMVN